MAEKIIEVYEWPKGQPRPGTTRKARESCIDLLQLPPSGEVPGRGDVVSITPENNPLAPVRYVVIEREFWAHMPNEDSQAGASYLSAWIFVRRIEDSKSEASKCL